MNEHDYGPTTTYEITWQTGHVERIEAHQVSWPNSMLTLPFEQPKPRRVQFHAAIDGRWTLQLSALEGDIRTIRNLATEALQPEAGS